MLLPTHSVGNPSGNKLTCNLSGSTRPQSSQLAEPLWTDPGLKSGFGVRELIATLEKKKKQKSPGGERIVEHSQKKNLQARKKPPPNSNRLPTVHCDNELASVKGLRTA